MDEHKGRAKNKNMWFGAEKAGGLAGTRNERNKGKKRVQMRSKWEKNWVKRWNEGRRIGEQEKQKTQNRSTTCPKKIINRSFKKKANKEKKNKSRLPVSSRFLWCRKKAEVSAH